jgi:hypothetical protein
VCVLGMDGDASLLLREICDILETRRLGVR